MKTYEDYYAEAVFRGHDPTKEVLTVIRAGVFLGIRLQTTFMANQSFYKALGFDTGGDVLARYRTAPGGIPSLLKINNQSDLARLGVIRELSFSVIPKDPTKVVPPYSAKCNTGVPYAVSRSLPDLVALIYGFEFSFGSGSTLAKYIVEPGSIKERKSRRTTPNFGWDPRPREGAGFCFAKLSTATGQGFATVHRIDTDTGTGFDSSMDETPLDEYITLLQNKTQIIDSYSRELQSYASLFKSLKIEVADKDFKALEKLLITAATSCDTLDGDVAAVAKKMQALLVAAEVPKNRGCPNRSRFGVLAVMTGPEVALGRIM